MKTSTSKFYLAILLPALILLSSCQRLDDQFFNPTSVSGEYQLEDYTGDTEIKLDSNYRIAESSIDKTVVFPSRTPYETSDQYIRGIYISGSKGFAKDTVILYLHGNKGNIDFYWNRAKLLAHVGGKYRYGVLIFDYRGYGLSRGTSNEASLYADTEGAMKWLKSKGVDGSRVIVYGFSLGTAPAVEFCQQSRILTPSKMILEAPMASAYALVEGAAKLNMPASFFTDLQLNNLKKIKRVIQPFLWLHGADDDYISMEKQGKPVYERYRGMFKQKAIVEGAGHSDLPTVMGLEGYKKTIYEFILRRR
ncbi:MAG: alpha/beta hydrolase [Bacteroidota bacterium]|jgi:pimeloyl-ACP methyl ester carboxylesterase